MGCITVDTPALAPIYSSPPPGELEATSAASHRFMSLPTAYTPLETLLLFQALRAEGVHSHSVFNRISDQLKGIPLIRSHPSYDGGRLSPDALRELYLWLLKDEVKADLERQLERDKLLQNGDLSPNSRKRKPPSPHLPTVHAASQHAHLIPQLVTRLYVRYREHAVRDIREHERRYDALAREIEEIEAGKWDERLPRQRTVSATQSPRPSTSPHTQQHNGALESPASVQKTIDPAGQSANKPYTQNKIDSLINHEPDDKSGFGHRRESSSTTLPPLSQMAPESPTLGIPPTVPVPLPAQSHTHGYIQSPPGSHHPSFTPNHAHPIAPAAPGSHGAQALSRPSSSPRPILPPPVGMKFPPHSPVQHVGSPGLHGPPMSQPPYAPPHPAQRPSTGPLAHDRPPYGYPMPPSPSSGHYQQPHYVDQRNPYGVVQQHPPASYPHPLVQSGSYPVLPYATAPQEMAHNRANHVSMQYPPPTQTPSLAQPPTHMPGVSSRPRQQTVTAPSTGPRPHRPSPRIVTDIIAALATPPRQQRKPVWKSELYLSPANGGIAIPRPEVEPLSPVLQRSELSGRATRSTRNREVRTSEQLEEPAASSVQTRVRGRTKRELSPHSVVSSNAEELTRMTRSQSVSTAGALPTSEDHIGSRGNVKIEPSTPAGFAEDTDTAHEVITSGGRMTRKRRGTLQSLQQPPQKRTRRQSQSGLGDDGEETATPSPRSSTIAATRNFHKLSQTIMNDINSHKHASYFANPVRDKDAPGYTEIVRNPQHLKGIRAAISAGSKAVNTAAAAADSPSVAETPTKAIAADGSTTIELERTEDVMPPKAIVNAAQLEKEVYRMFANAVMFNPGEDGLVADTREMFEDVEAKLVEWRGAEKEAGGAGIGSGVDGAEEEEGRAKRRKL